jgi:nicotinate-nucleotide--dimethylbenzimidazole phosphoribosyltransferase
MAAAIFTAATRSTAVLVDGPAAVAAVMLARDFGLAAPKWCYAPNRSTHPVVVKLAKQAGLADDLALELDLPDGTALPLGWELIQAGLRISQSLPMPVKEEPEPEPDVPVAGGIGVPTPEASEAALAEPAEETEPAEEPEATGEKA